MNGMFRLLAITTVMWLSGCAHNQLLRLETKDYVVATRQAEAGGRAFYDGIIASDRALWASLHAYDPKCMPRSLRDSYFDADTNGDGRVDKEDQGLRCVTHPTSFARVPSEDIDRATFAKQYAALDFVASYLNALAEASADPELKAADAFKQASADLDVLFRLFKTESPVDKDEVAAIQELVDLIDELAKDARSAAEIRSIVRKRGARAEAAFAALSEWLMRDAILKQATDGIALHFNAFRAIDGRASDVERGRIIETHYAGIDAREAVEQRYATCMAGADVPLRRFCSHPEAGLMHLAGQSHRELTGLVDGRMSARQKARFMSLQRAYFFRVASLFLDLTSVF
jgi:hypothetical protein